MAKEEADCGGREEGEDEDEGAAFGDVVVWRAVGLVGLGLVVFGEGAVELGASGEEAHGCLLLEAYGCGVECSRVCMSNTASLQNYAGPEPTGGHR